MKVPLLEWLIHFRGQCYLPWGQARVQVLKPLIYHGCHGYYLWLQEHVLVEELHVELPILQLGLLFLVLNDFQLMRGLNQKGFCEYRNQAIAQRGDKHEEEG